MNSLLRKQRERLAIQAGIDAMDDGKVADFSDFDREFREKNGLKSRKMAKVEIAEPAKADIHEAFDWWSENRSASQAAEWYERIFEAITTLERMPERGPRVSESGLSRVGVRQFLIGIGSRPTH